MILTDHITFLSRHARTIHAKMGRAKTSTFERFANDTFLTFLTGGVHDEILGHPKLIEYQCSIIDGASQWTGDYSVLILRVCRVAEALFVYLLQP